MKGSDSVEEDVLVLGVGDLFPALQPPHGLPHVLGLQGRRFSPLVTHIQCWKRKKGIRYMARTPQCIMGFVVGDTPPY